MFIEFLPENYEAPKSFSGYLKLQDGDTKIRILSRPIIGWEDWEGNSPIRYRMDAKPDKPKDAKRPLKHFWSMIVWNYNEEKIQIMHCTQASIIKSLTDLIRDSDWGSPFEYDIKINKSGKDMQTKYAVMPLPHKKCSKDIISEFHSKPCNLEMLFENKDPFAPSDVITEGHFGSESDKSDKSDKNEKITEDQYQQLVDLIYDDKEYLNKLNENVRKHFGVTDLKHLPKSKYDSVYKSVKMHAQEKAQKEMNTKTNNIPF